MMGLGNPGRKYKYSRHNVGFMAVEKIARELGVSLSEKTASARVAVAERPGYEVVLAVPTTFMNLSGKAVTELMTHYKVNRLKEMLVIVDDADLEFGSLRLREKGSSGGHRGLASIEEALQSSSFQRLRVGVGRPLSRKIPLEEHVLGSFSRQEKKELVPLLEKVCDACVLWMDKGAQVVMNRFNR